MKRRKDGVPGRTGHTPRLDLAKAIIEDEGEIPVHGDDEDFEIEGGESLQEAVGDEIFSDPN